MEDEDPFSSFIIHPDPNPSIEATISSQNPEDQIENPKLQARRKKKKHVNRSSNINESRYKIIVKYGGYFKPINNGAKEKYYSGKQRTIYLDETCYSVEELFEEVRKFYLDDDTLKLSLLFLDKRVSFQSFIQIEDDTSYKLMLSMYEEEKKVIIYVNAEKVTTLEEGIRIDEIVGTDIEIGGNECRLEDIEYGSDYCHSEDSYLSLDSETDDEIDIEYEGEFYSYDKDDPKMDVGAQFPHVIAFRRALSHYAITHDFEFDLGKSEPTRVTATCASRDCNWRIHATVAEDEVTFVVRTLEANHTCFGVNRSGNRHANKSWIADRIIDDLRREGDVSAKELKQRVEKNFSISLPYNRVWKAKELAIEEIYGKWKDSLVQVGALKEEILRRNPESVVELKTQPEDGSERHFQRFFVALGACTSGFLMGCRPYIGIDACHLKNKWQGVLASATAIDGNNWMYPVAYAVMEIESEDSWEWFLTSLHKAIGMPNGLVISSDMQKGLQNAIEKVYPLAEHRECMRHLFSNFKKHYHGDIFKFGLWGAARTYSLTRFTAFINEIEAECPAAIQYLRKEHNKLWSRSKFGTISKCDNLTNNIAETFNNWITQERNKPIVDLIDSIRQKIMMKFEQRRKIARSLKGPLVPKVADDIKLMSRNLGGYDLRRSTDFCAEIQKSGKRWEVNLLEKECSCRAWQVKGVPCVHAAVFIASLRNVSWENYVDSYFTVARLRTAYANGIATMPSKDEWLSLDLGYKMLPPILKRPAGRPRKNRIKSCDEPKRRSHKCTRCGQFGHYRKTCKNAVPSQEGEGTSHGEIKQKLKAKRVQSKDKAGSKKRACPPSIFKLLQEEKI